MTTSNEIPTVTLLSFRAECQADVVEIIQRARMSGIEVEITQHNPDVDGRPDVEMEMEVSATLEQFRASLVGLTDIHVAIETMRPVPLAENSLERDSTLI